jgi:HemY protein
MMLFFVAVAAAALGAGYLLEFDGGLQISVGTNEFNLGALQAVILIGVLLLTFWVLLKLAGFLVALLRFLNGDETAISRYFDRNREARGYKALNEAMVALASGEGREALRGASRAERLLQQPQLTNLVAAQAAELAGDTTKAEEVYKALLTDDRTRFVGVRGIMKQRLASGDTETALKLAEKAFAIKPKHVEVQDTLLKLQAEKEDWAGARRTLATKLSTGTLPRDIHRRRDAVLALPEAQARLDGDDAVRAQEEFIEANRLSPDLVPAAVMAARGYIQKGQPRYATRVIKKAWGAAPHPELAAAFAEIEPNETPGARIKRFAPLVKMHPEHAESKMLQAELMIAAEDFPGARRAMGDLAESDPTKRSLTLMAAIERGEGPDDAVVKAWLAKALTASPGPQWICDVSGKAYPEWVPYTEGGFDTLSWKRADTEETGLSSNAAGMLPMIVGAPTPAAAAKDEADVIDASATPAEETEKAGAK